MREDFAQTSRFEVQSTSDQQDFRIYPTIAATAAMMMLPEQAANWAYPSSHMNEEEVAFNLNTTMLGRFFLSGYINQMADEQRRLCAEAISAYKHEVQPVISSSIPFWPLGSLPRFSDAVVAYGLQADRIALMTIWARNVAKRQSAVRINLTAYIGKDIEIVPIFPEDKSFARWNVTWNQQSGTAVIQVPDCVYASRTFKIIEKEGADI
jgi:alpha-galactosidase